MSNAINTYNPDYAVHPGEYLEEILESRNIKQRDLADRMCVKETYVSKMIHGEKPVGPDMALKLERVLGVSSDIWNNMNSSYRLFEARKKEKEELAKKIDWLKDFPLLWMKKLNIIDDTKKNEYLVEKLLDFFEVSSPEAFSNYYHKQAVAYRKSESFKSNIKANYSWFKAAECFATSIEINKFDKELFEKQLLKIRKLTIENLELAVDKMINLCKEAGVALVFLPEPKGAFVYGATKWLQHDKVMIALSLRRKSDDQFWFSFFHEAGHVLLHGHNAVFIDDEDVKGSKDKKELEANQFARNILIPDDEYKQFVKRGHFFREDISEFAYKQNISPGIVVGFLQHDGLIEFRFHNKLKQKIEFEI